MKKLIDWIRGLFNVKQEEIVVDTKKERGYNKVTPEIEGQILALKSHKLKHRDIANIVGVSTATVSRIYRANIVEKEVENENI